MSKQSYIAYYRVSTDRQGQSGLGLEAQETTVQGFLKSHGGRLVESFTEVESGKNGDREQLAKAINRCKVKNAVLLVSKLDRLSRSVAFIANLQQSGVKFVIAENPQLTDLTIHILAAVAQAERESISTRTKQALQAAKRRGVTLGNPNLDKVRNTDTTAATTTRMNKADEYAAMMVDAIEDIREELESPSLRQIASELNNREFTTRRGSAWTAASVQRVIQRTQAD
ncbi:MAG: recombinase family protein [Neptuniibacter sp.]